MFCIFLNAHCQNLSNGVSTLGAEFLMLNQSIKGEDCRPRLDANYVAIRYASQGFIQALTSVFWFAYTDNLMGGLSQDIITTTWYNCYRCCSKDSMLA